MDLLQCVSPTFPDSRTRKSAISTPTAAAAAVTYSTVDKPMRRSPVRLVRQVQSEERDVQQGRLGNNLSLPVQRRISLPAGHYAASPGKFSRFFFYNAGIPQGCSFLFFNSYTDIVYCLYNT